MSSSMYPHSYEAINNMDDSIQIVEYQPKWPLLFEEEKASLLGAIAAEIVAIEFIGSTAVPGLAAKPIIDIAIALHQLPPTKHQIQALKKLGYTYEEEKGIPGRYFFYKGMPRTHHLHLVFPQSELWENYLLLRDFLRSHPTQAQQYESLKRQLAIQYQFDRQGYTEGKSAFISNLLDLAKAGQQPDLQPLTTKPSFF